MSGPVAVNEALQDPFSNLLQRGALHEHQVILDVTVVPDEPVSPGKPILLGTCKCADGTQGLRLTVEDGSKVTDAGGGRLRIAGTFDAVVTAADQITLRNAR